jgi:hypothetical protein
MPSAATRLLLKMMGGLGSSGVIYGFLLLEDGTNLLLEDGTDFLLES